MPCVTDLVVMDLWKIIGNPQTKRFYVQPSHGVSNVYDATTRSRCEVMSRARALVRYCRAFKTSTVVRCPACASRCTPCNATSAARTSDSAAVSAVFEPSLVTQAAPRTWIGQWPRQRPRRQ